MKRIAIFDLDGTLLDTVADLADSVNYALAMYGYPLHPVDSYYKFVGNGISKLIERALPQNNREKDTIEALLPVFRNYYNSNMMFRTCPYPGIEHLLQRLNDAGIKIAVASNKYQSATEELVKHFFPSTTFEIVLGQRPDVPIKPNPAIVEEILSFSNINPCYAIYVGDSLVDIQTAKNAKIDMIAVSWGFSPENDLVNASPKFVVRNTDELEQILF